MNPLNKGFGRHKKTILCASRANKIIFIYEFED
jgi:hypothetical protein